MQLRVVNMHPLEEKQKNFHLLGVQHYWKEKLNVTNIPAEFLLKEIQVEVLFEATSKLGISKTPSRDDFGEPSFPCFIFTGKSSGAGSSSISSAMTFGMSSNSRVCSSGVSSSFFLSK